MTHEYNRILLFFFFNSDSQQDLRRWVSDPLDGPPRQRRRAHDGHLRSHRSLPRTPGGRHLLSLAQGFQVPKRKKAKFGHKQLQENQKSKIGKRANHFIFGKPFQKGNKRPF
jgi:hypothetical protein